MASAELILRFPDPGKVNVSFDGTDSGQLGFTNPLTDEDHKDLRWYVETYGARSLADVDDQEARRIEQRLPEIGKALFRSVFQAGEGEGRDLYLRFRDANATPRLLTINTQEAAILSLPWELLHDPTGKFLFQEKPRISVRRRITGATGGRKAFAVQEKDTLHLLFVVSRPSDAGFIDPRADPQAVLTALDENAAGRVTWEFLYPPTLKALAERLDDDRLPAVDILHFDGHGVFANVSEDDAEKEPGQYDKSILSEIHRERQRRGDETGERVRIGFLLFEKEDGTKRLVSAANLADNLFQHQVGLVVLSACQTATMDAAAGDPMASVAGKLTHTGIPAILAMTHSVLVKTTETLFGKFYQSLARGRGIGTSLDDARATLNLPSGRKKYEVRRGGERKMLSLQDWFVPALFHGGKDSALLTGTTNDSDPRQASIRSAQSTVKHNLRERHEAGFFGRRRELWEIERWFAGETRRISITGFGGQGKTELAFEAGRWLLRTGMFQQAVFIDYANVQSADPVSVAVSTISSVLQETFIDKDAVTAALQAAPTLLILDNLETLESQPLQELLTAASAWSQAGDSRVLLTSRLPETGHADFAIQGTFRHRRIRLKGLGSATYPDDALDWFIQLDRLPDVEPRQVPPPKRGELIRLFERVRFHPLSICVLVQQLKTRTADQLEKRLEELLSFEATSLIAVEGTPDSLPATLQLSLERLSEEEHHDLRRLGVFQGGAFEDDLLAITELGDIHQQEREQLQTLLAAVDGGDPRVLLKMMGQELPEDRQIPPELLQQLMEDPELQQHIEQLRDRLNALPKPVGENVWPALRRDLEAAALIEAESVPEVGPPFLRFHPTLAPMLWAGLTDEERDALSLAHRKRYYGLANYLYNEDSKKPHFARAIIRRELPNLLHAVHGALDTSDADAVNFVSSINLFLNYFGMTREAALLNQRAEQMAGERGSSSWYLAQSNRGRQMRDSGRTGEAIEVFKDILKSLGEEPGYQCAVTLGHLGRCYEFSGRPDLAEATYRQGIAVTEQLEATDPVKRQRAVLCTDLADVLRHQGKYAEARQQYELGLEVKKEVHNLTGQGVTLIQLGTLAMAEGDLTDAVKRYVEALELFQRLGEPAVEASVQHQLGIAFQKARQWEQAEYHYRESARLEEQLGNLAGAASTWNQLAVLAETAGNSETAETWYRKTIDGFRKTGDTALLSKALNNLADLLSGLPGRLNEARELAEEGLTIKQTLDPGAATIWKTYTILAKIADLQDRPDEAAEYRRLAREAKRNFAGTAHELKRHLPVILGTLQALQQPDDTDEFHQGLSKMGERGWTDLVQAIRRILDGERDPESLCASLDLEDSMIIETILAAIDDPNTLAPLLPPKADNE